MKSLTLVLCVIAILGSAASTFFYFEIGKSKDVLKKQVTESSAATADLTAKLAEATTKGDSLQKQVLSLDNERAEAISKASAAESRSTQLTRDVAQLNNQVTAKADAEKSLNTEISQLKRDLAQARLATSSATPEEIEGYKTKIDTLEARLKELSSTPAAVASTSGMSASGSTEAGSTTPAAPVAAPSDLSAEVVSIGAQNAFVVLNAGSAKGVQAGQNFAITRGGNNVAKAQVSSVLENYAVAQISAGSLQGSLNKGDIAALTK